MTLILGAGLAGLSCSYHLGHESCLLLEKNANAFSHIAADRRDGFTWDPGPHVSFTKHEYVRNLFADSVSGEYDEYEVQTGNYYRSHWIDHPAQSALHQVYYWTDVCVLRGAALAGDGVSK
jgi:protoporphyrinogen oxidase